MNLDTQESMRPVVTEIRSNAEKVFDENFKGLEKDQITGAQIYILQCKYVGPLHEEFCVELMDIIFKYMKN